MFHLLSIGCPFVSGRAHSLSALTHQLAPAGLFVWHLLKQAAPHSRLTFICTQLSACSRLLYLPTRAANLCKTWGECARVHEIHAWMSVERAATDCKPHWTSSLFTFQTRVTSSVNLQHVYPADFYYIRFQLFNIHSKSFSLFWFSINNHLQ